MDQSVDKTSVDDDRSVASSSGLEDGDITIIGHEKDFQYLSEIEKHLEANYSLVRGYLIAGRSKHLNLLSSIRHAKHSIVVLTKQYSEELQDLIQKYSPEQLLTPRTLIVYEEKRARCEILKKQQHIRVSSDPQRVAEEITRFVETSKEHEFEYGEGVNDVPSEKKLYGSLLIASLLNPDIETLRNTVISKFAKKYGAFADLQLGGENKFFKSSPLLQMLANRAIGLSDEGKIIFESWKTRVEKRIAFQSRMCNPARKEKIKDWISKNEDSKEQGESLLAFVNKMEKPENEKAAYFLMCTKLPTTRDYAPLGNIPWLRVFDFDPQSRQDGLLNQVHSAMSTKRHLTQSTLADSTKDLGMFATDWLFMKGHVGEPSSVHDGEFMEWQQEQELEKVMRETDSFCFPGLKAKFLVMWYDLMPDSLEYLEEIIRVIRKSFNKKGVKGYPVDMILCIPERNDELDRIINKYGLQNSVIIISPSAVATCISYIGPKEADEEKPTVPGRTEGGDPCEVQLEESELAWYNQHFELVPLNRRATQVEATGRSDSTPEFLHGGLATWDDLDHGKIVVERKMLQESSRVIQKLVKEVCEPKVFRVYHAPSGGGTTFFRQLVWKLKCIAPCLIMHLPVNLSELVDRLENLYKKARMPIIAIQDGGSDCELLQVCKRKHLNVILLHVQRTHEHCTNQLEPNHDRLNLSGLVTVKEATQICKVLERHAPENNKTALQQLGYEAVRTELQMYEFGLTAFGKRYKGIKKYVQEYMGTIRIKLLPWQQTIAYLSLLLHYGQQGIHKNVFQCLLNTNKDVEWTDIPYRAQQFLTLINDGEWKIIYDAVAKEILEYVLLPPGDYEGLEITDKLSRGAARGLHQLMIDFIRELQNVDGSRHSPMLVDALTAMVIRRDRSFNDDKTQKQSYSRFLNDVPADKDRIAVLVALTEAFPNNGNFHAHLGRFYSAKGRFDEAEKSLKAAIQQCSQPLELGRTHNMFGYSYVNGIKQLLKQQNDQLDQATKNAQQAVCHFRQSLAFETYNLSYSFMGEIKARLLIAQHVREKFGACDQSTLASIEACPVETAVFVGLSYPICYQLLQKCKLYSTEKELSRCNYEENCKKYYSVFSNPKPGSELTQDLHLNVDLARSRVTYMVNSLKNKVGAQDGFFDSASTVREIVQLSERLINDILSHSNVSVSISVDMFILLKYIRSAAIQDVYNFEDVLKLVEQWEARKQKGLASYYTYVLNFMLVLFSSEPDKRSRYLQKAVATLKSMQKRSTAGRETTHHWKTLEVINDNHEVTVRKLTQWHDDQWSNADALKKLQIWTGSIIDFYHESVGFIAVDSPGAVAQNTVKVYFNPKKYRLDGKVYATQKTRVEFFLGFHTHNGAEAFSVRTLTQLRCEKCHLSFDIITLRETENKCQRCMQPQEANVY